MMRRGSHNARRPRPIAVRELRLTSHDSPLRVSIDRPRTQVNGWACEYAIDFPDRPVVRTVCGADSLHALMLAIEGLQAEVLDAEAKGLISVNWEGSKFVMSRRLRRVLKD